MTRFASWLGSAALLLSACGDDGSNDDGADTGSHATATQGHDSGTAAHDDGETHHASETGHPEPPAVCGELSSVCHDLGEEMGGMYETCHEIGHDGDLAACEAAYDECIALCTGAGTGGSDSSGADSSGAGSSDGGDDTAGSTGTAG